MLYNSEVFRMNNTVEITYNNFNEINKLLNRVYIALNDEGYMGIYNKKNKKSISMLPFEGRYNIKELEMSGLYNEAELYIKKHSNNDSLQDSIKKLWNMWKSQRITTDNYFKVVSNIQFFESALNDYIEKYVY